LRQSSRDSSPNRSWSGPGRMTAPDSEWPPHTLAFSITATGTSPSFSISSGSSPRSWSRRFAQASPAVPPPTIATPTSISSSSGSSPRLMNSLWESTGGGNAAGATLPLRSLISARPPRLHGLCELGQDLVQVADDAEVGEFEDRRVRVLVDRDDVLRALHPDLVLDRAGDTGREVQLRRHRLAGLADLRGVGVPAGVHHRARRRDRGVAAERL